MELHFLASLRLARGCVVGRRRSIFLLDIDNPISASGLLLTYFRSTHQLMIGSD